MLIIITDTTIRSDLLRAKVHQNYSRNVKKYTDTIDWQIYLYIICHNKKNTSANRTELLKYIPNLELNKEYFIGSVSYIVSSFLNYNDWVDICCSNASFTILKYEIIRLLYNYMFETCNKYYLKMHKNTMIPYNISDNDYFIIDDTVYFNVYNYDIKVY